MTSIPSCFALFTQKCGDKSNRERGGGARAGRGVIEEDVEDEPLSRSAGDFHKTFLSHHSFPSESGHTGANHHFFFFC